MFKIENFMGKFRKSLLLGLSGLVLLGCNGNSNNNLEQIVKKQEASEKVYQVPQESQTYKKVSYKLNKLCDTKVDWKDMKINVYMEDSKVLYDYHKYRDEIFGYVKDFFKENKINCQVIYSDNNFLKFDSFNEFGVEIVSSNIKMKNRRDELLKSIGITPRYDPYIMHGKGYGVTRASIALINGGWEEFRSDLETGEMTPEDMEKQFSRNYKGISVKEYLFKQNAGLICHEVLHCLGLPHPYQFEPPIVRGDDFIPNIMGNSLPRLQKEFQDRYSVGYSLEKIQKKLVHSFLAGKNNFKAFVSSERNLDVYLENLEKANNLELLAE